MPKRMIKGRIVLVREGKRVELTIGEPFNLTADEIKEIEANHPEAISLVTQTVVDDDDADSDVADDGGSKDTQKSAAGKAKPKGDAKADDDGMGGL
jgi:hypothetical protein